MLQIKLFIFIFTLGSFTMLNAQPQVLSVTPNLTTIADANTGPATFTITVVFDQTMNTAPLARPNVTFPTPGEDPTASPTITLTGEAWSTTTLANDTYTATYNVTDNNDNIPDIDVRVADGQNAGGTLQTIYNEANVFSVDMLQPTVTNVAASVATITDANAGIGTFSITITFSEALNTGVTPTVAFNTVGEDPVAVGVLSNPVGAWSGGNTVYTVTYDVTDNATNLFNIDVDVAGAQDIAGNNQAANYDANNNFSIKLSNATVTLATTNLTTVTDANIGAGTFSITLTFSETMDGVTNPAISFPNAGGQTTLTTNSNAWNGANNQFTLAYTVTDNNENIANIDIRAINARDTYGNTMQQYDEAAKFNIDMLNPQVSAFSVSTNPITDANAGGTITFTIDFNENMITDGSADPTISFPTVGEDPTINTLTFNSGIWSSNTRYVATYNVADANETISNIDVRVTGAQDAAGNTQIQYDNANFLNVDTQNPTVNSITTNLTTIIDANAGSNFTITVVYSENMNTGINPTISFPIENPGSTISFTSGAWSNATTYVATYSITDLNQSLANIDISASGARDVAGNTQVANTQVDVFNIDMVVPLVSLITPSPATITDANVGANTFTLTLDYSEAMNTGTNPTITFPTVGENPSTTITYSSGVWASNTQFVARYNVADNGDNILNIDVQVSGAADAAGNTQSTPTTNNVFSIDMANATVTGVTPNVTTITDGNVGTGTFTLTVVYDKNMNTGINPVISFPTAGEDPTASITFNSGSWSNATTYIASYDVADVNEAVSAIDLSVAGAQDASGNTQATGGIANNFSIDTQNPTVNSITTNLTTIVDANAGSNFTITVVYSENMNTGINPTISFPIENPGSTISFTSGAWSNATTYVATYSITDLNQSLANIDISASGARDVAGNTQVANTQVDVFNIDMVVPLVSLITPSPATITDANVGANTFTLTLDYSEAMNTGTNPTITFPTVGENPSTTITYSSGVWASNTQFVARYNVADNGDNILNIDVQVSGAADAAGNTQSTPTTNNVFSIDMANATVTGVTPNVTTITDGNVGTGTFTLTVVYDKNMNTGINPVISFPTAGEDPTASITFNSGSWSNATTYIASYDVADVNEAVSAIDLSVAGAQDASGNTQTISNIPNNFNIDTQNPAVSSLTVNLNPIVKTDAGSNFTVTVVYSEAMNQTIDPTISFPIEIPGSTLPPASFSGAWSNATTYVFTCPITDANQELANIDIQISGARDANNNMQISYTAVDAFSIDMRTPSLNPLTITSNNTNNTSLAKSGDIVTVSFTASETLAALPTASIGGQPATVTNTGGLNYTATRTLDGSETEGLCNFNISFSDAVGNPATATNLNITNASSVTLDFTAPNNQDAVFTTSVTQYGGSTVSINSSGDNNNKVWFAPAGQTAETDFIAGPTMTQAASGTATAILAPANEGTYYIYVIDEAGNMSLPSTASLTVNNVPQLANIELGALRYIEGSGQVAITSTIEVFDDLNSINSATVQITGNYQNAEDVLAFTNTANITGAWNALTGILTLTGADTKAAYQAALRSVTYENTSVTPSNLTRTVSFTINDGTYNSNTETRDINLTPVLTVPGDYPSIQIAINNAINGDRIVVASGTYPENINFNGKQIEIIGNGPGNSIIDGNASGSVVTFATGETANCLLRGFTIRNGTGTNINLALPYSLQANYGGGIYINGASPVLENLIVESNSVAIDGENGGSGGGIYIGNGSNVQFNNVTVRNNIATRYQGGGITIENSNVVFNTVTISNNTTGNYGGGISARNANLDFTDVTITGNTAPGPNGMGGGMFLINCTLNFNNVISNSNTAATKGNGVCTYSTPVITTGAPNNITDNYTRLD